MKNLLAIFLVWFGCALAWVILGSTIIVRSGDMSTSLTDQVYRLWGPPLQQPSPQIAVVQKQKRREQITSYDTQGRPFTHEVERETDVETESIPLDQTDAHASLSLEHRRKGLLWYPTYGVQLKATYAFVNRSDAERRVVVHFPLATTAGPDPDAPVRESSGAGTTVFDEFTVSDAGGRAIAAVIEQGTASWTTTVAPGERPQFTVSYKARGTSRWYYHPSRGTAQVRNFSLQVDTDFAKVDFPAGSISPTTHGPQGSGWRGQWRFGSLVAGAPIGIDLPDRLNPGPLASRMTFFAPVGLLFFFFVVAIFATASDKRFHPLNYFFLGCSFFAFHLLFAYLVDHLAIAPSFAIAAAVSIGLAVTYAPWFVGWRFALLQIGVAQLIYLVLFSFTFFWEGFTGLAIAIGAVVTLFVMMQLTGRLKPSPAR